MDDKATETNEGMCNQGGFDSLMHVRALNGSDNIQKLLFSCAGGRCWEILQSMWVVARERQEIRKGGKEEEERVWNSSETPFSRIKNITQGEKLPAGALLIWLTPRFSCDTFALKPVANYQLINVICLRTAFVWSKQVRRGKESYGEVVQLFLLSSELRHFYTSGTTANWKVSQRMQKFQKTRGCSLERAIWKQD